MIKINTARTLAALPLSALLFGSPIVVAGSARIGEAQERIAADAPAGAAAVPVSFRFATREEGHELLLTNVHVVIVCPVAGTLFEAVSDGPFLLANVPAGRYDVIASHEGRSQRVALDVVRGQPGQLAFYW